MVGLSILEGLSILDFQYRYKVEVWKTNGEAGFHRKKVPAS